MKSSFVSPIDFDFLRDLLRSAGSIALGQRGRMEAALKADLTPVTVVDKQVETYLIDRILQRYPDHQILSEETGARAGRGTLTWVIDPIDGTRAFASGLPVWGVSIGILHGNDPLAGGLYLPVTGELYWAGDGQAFYNDHQLPRVESLELHSPLTFLAVPSNFHRKFAITYPRVRSMGSAAAHMAYTGTGAAVGALAGQYGLWDIAGMLPFVDALGIKVETLSGTPFLPQSMLDGSKAREPVLAAHPSVIGQLREMIRLL